MIADIAAHSLATAVFAALEAWMVKADDPTNNTIQTTWVA